VGHTCAPWARWAAINTFELSASLAYDVQQISDWREYDVNPDQRRVLLETADDIDKLYEKRAHEIRMLGLNELYDALTELRKYAEQLRTEASEDE
jgi:hypothetical protein